MTKCSTLTTALLIALAGFSFLLSAATANVAGYTVEPAVPGIDTVTPLETVQDTVWDLTPRDIATILALSISPVFLLPVELFFLLKLFAYLGYRKIAATNVLENKSRDSIYSCIRENPGIQFNALSRKTAVTPGTMKYHLTVLRFMNKIVFLETCGHIRYFENSGLYSLLEQKVLTFLRNEADRSILEYILSDPGLSRKDLERHLNISGSAVSWHIRRLSADGIVVVRKSGRDAHYEISPQARQYVEKYLTSVSG
jgi:predicted transcriptional regulator